MSTFTLYRDIADLLTIVRDDGWGWPGAYWSTGLFVTDAWAISRRRKTELSRATQAWARRCEWPEPIATWSRVTGEFVILDELPGHRAERYLGMGYAPERWARLAPDAFVAAIRATAMCRHTKQTAILAIRSAEPHQLSRLRDDLAAIESLRADGLFALVAPRSDLTSPHRSADSRRQGSQSKRHK